MLKITITIDQKGDVQVEGPLDQKVVCLGILEMAKEAVMKFEPKRRLVQTAHGPVPLIVNGR